DRYGRRPVVLVCLALYVLGSLIAAAANSVLMLDGARVIQGVGRMRRHGAVARHGRRSLCRQWGGTDHLADEPHSEHRACRCTGAGRHADHGAELALAVRTDGPLRDAVARAGVVLSRDQCTARPGPPQSY